jgi:tetratricopeptide (TPR) repeat protein
MDDREIEATYDLVHQAALAGIDRNRDEEDYRDHPMFRTELPDDVDNDRHLSCFQHLLYEGQTPDTLALHFKELGNELYKSGRQNWSMAAHWWTRGLKENPTDLKLRSILHSNRATISLALQQYQKAALDADWAIKYDTSNRRAYIRAAHAYQGMCNWDKALGAANAGLEILPADDPLRVDLEKVIQTVTTELSAVNGRITNFFRAINACSSYFTKRGLSVGRFAYTWMANWDLVLKFDEDNDETIWPLVICYDEVLQVDFVDGVGEKTPLRVVLEMILPGKVPDVKAAAWDTDESYKVDTVQLYVSTNHVISEWGRRVKPTAAGNLAIDPEVTLRDVFAQKDYVVPGYPILYIAVRGSRFANGLGIAETLTPRGRVRVGQ